MDEALEPIIRQALDDAKGNGRDFLTQILWQILKVWRNG
jgi:hypothetical protein